MYVVAVSYSVQVINFGFEYLKIDVFERTSLLFYLWFFAEYVLFPTMGFFRHGVLTILMNMALCTSIHSGVEQVEGKGRLVDFILSLPSSLHLSSAPPSRSALSSLPGP